MNLKKCFFTFLIFALMPSLAQEKESVKNEKIGEHENINRFRQLYEEMATPNIFRTAAGAPGPKYYQQQADYTMDITLDEVNEKLYGNETITYSNNSPDKLEYLWVQLDQNIREKDTKTSLIDPNGVPAAVAPATFTASYLKNPFDGGFKIESVTDTNKKNISYTINQTMMRINLKKPLMPNEKYTFNVKWWYTINNHVTNRARSGFEYFPEDDNNLFIIAQFFPRMCVYNDVEGWQNNQFWGRGEFALPFGNYNVTITAPADHILDGTGKLMNRKDVFTKEQNTLWEKAQNEFETPVIIVSQKEAEKKEKTKSKKTKKWKFQAKNVRDFAFSSSRKFIYDAMAVKINNRKVMAISMYPKEGNPLWEQYSTKAIATTLESYSKYTFDYPYHKAISVHSKRQGMEYPMICWNYGRPDKDGKYSDRVKYGMISVIIHEIGHNFFPMIVNSDERQWTWMDEGLNTFMQYLAEQSFQKKYLPELDAYPSRRGPAKKIVPYMSGDQKNISPIMSNSENIYQFGNNAYGKPATGLNILRETIMGHDLFDYSFKTYAKRWKFKHPTPEDFFRTMEDASAIDLDWFWRGWFYTTSFVDIGVKNVKTFFLTSKPNKRVRDYLTANKLQLSELGPLVFAVSKDSEDYTEDLSKNSLISHSDMLKKYLDENLSAEERKTLKNLKFLYEVKFEKLGSLPMPIIAEFTYADGDVKRIKYPALIWRKYDKEVSQIIVSEKEITKIVIDPEEETADINLSNNIWPKTETISEFDKFKEKQK